MPEQTEDYGNSRGSGVGRPRSPSQSVNINSHTENNRKRVGSAKHYDIATALMGKGKTVDLEELFVAAARDGDYERIEDFLLRSGKDHMISIDVKDKRTGNTPIIWAAKRGHTKIVQLLLKHGADVTLRNYEGQTALEVASSTIKTLLLDSVERSTESSHRLLLQAAWQGNIKVLRKLLSENRVRDINCQNGDGLTPLLLVTRDIQMFERLSIQLNKAYNPVECVAELLDHRADIHAVDDGGKTCLHYASQSKATLAQTVVHALITGGPNIDVQDKRLFAPIHCASQIGNVECLEVLIEGGSSVNHKGFAGTTPLHITAYNDHERAACCLLKHGADITITDDRGLTAVDLARGKKMKNTLKEAWSEATMNRTQTSLGPLRTASREDLRNSNEDFNNKKKKNSGEVIYDNMPANPFTSVKSTNRGKMVTRHLSLKDKANKAEEIMMKDIENGNFTPGPYVKDGVRRLGLVRNQKPSPLPKGFDRLPAISPDRLSADRNTESPAFSRNSRLRRSLDETRLSSSRGGPKNKLATFPAANNQRRVTPMSTKEGGMQIVSLADDAENVQTINRLTPASPRQSYHHHRRSGSDTMASPNLGELAASCDPYLLQRGRSVSLTSQPLSQSADFGDLCVNSPRLAPLQRAPLEREITCVSEHNEGLSNNNPVALDLDRMGLINKCQTPVQNVPLYPTSSKVLPPTPTMLGQKSHCCLESRMTDHPDSGESSKEVSPRSDEEAGKERDKSEVRLAFENTSSLLRSRSILKEEFVLEESRPKDLILQSSTSDDSSTGSKDRLSVSSGEMSPWENKSTANQQKTQGKIQNEKSGVLNKVKNDGNKCSVVSVNAQSRLTPNLRTISRKKNVSGNVSLKSNSTVTNKEKTFDNKDKIIVHSQSLGAKTVLPEDKSNNTKSPVGEGLNAKSSNKANKENSSGAKQTNFQGKMNSSASKAPMQVVSTKLMSNVREEVRKMKDVKTEDNASPVEQMSDIIQGDNTKVIASNSKGGTESNDSVKGYSATKANQNKLTSGTTGNNTKGDNSVNPVPSYLLPTQSSSSRQNTQDARNQSHSRNSGSETARKSSLTTNTYQKTSQSKTGACKDNSSQDQKGCNNAASAKQKASLTSSQSNLQTSRTVPDKISTIGAQQSSSVIKKSQSDTSISMATRETIPNSALKPSVKSRSVSLDSNSSSRSNDKTSCQSSASKASNMKSVSMTTIQETKDNGSANVNLKSQSTANIMENKEQQNSSPEESPHKASKIQYKPASAGKPPLVEIVPAGTPRISKSKCIDSEVVMPIQTPVIVNPFEDMIPYQTDLENTKSSSSSKKINDKGVSATSYGYVVTKPTLERSKTTASNKSISNSKSKRPSSKEPKPTSAGLSRQGGRRRGARSKDSKLSDEGGGGRPRSGKKRVKSGKRRKRGTTDAALSKQAAQSDVALISGIGWHVATSCMDKSDVTVVKNFDSDSDSSEDENDLNLPTPRFSNINVNSELPTPRFSNINIGHLQVPNLGDPASNQSTPRFLEVKAEEKHSKELAVMSNDGYPPMNLDMTQASLPVNFDLSHMLARENSQSSLPVDISTLVHKITSNGKMNEGGEQSSEVGMATDAVHRQILMGKLTPIPESPSLRSTAMIHKTMEAIEKFDKDIQEETLNNLLGLVKDSTAEPTPRQDSSQKHSAKTSTHKSLSQPSSLSNSAKQQGSASVSRSGGSKRLSNGDKSAPSSSKDRSAVHSVKSTRSENKRSANRPERTSATNQKTLSGKSDRIIVREAGVVKEMVSSTVTKPDNVHLDETMQLMIPSPPRVPKLQNLGDSESDSDDSWRDNFEKKKEPLSTRRERVFSETKSDDKDEEFIDEAINEIMSNTLPSNTSTLRSQKSLVSAKSLSSTFSEADKHLLIKLSAQNDSPFYPKMSSATERVRQSGSLEDLTAPHPTNPNLLKVFHADKYQLGQKMKAMIDAGADGSKVKAMANADSEAKQIAKIMNSFRNMELYAGPASVKTPGKDNSHILKPEVSSADPYIGRKPPLARPNSAGAGKARSAGRFTEIKSEKKPAKVDKDRTPRQSGQAKEDRVLRRSADTQNLRSSTYIINDTSEQELANVMRTKTPDNEGDGPSRSGSACTTISSQSSIEETIQWKKGNVLGKGAFGTVWCGLTNEGQLIAVKQIELNTVDKDKAKREYEKVQEEVELLKTISHKNIVGYLGTSLEENIVSIFMQFVPGGSIASILARFGALDEAVFRRYTRQILEGVEYLHANDVIHRDIKGGNVMLMPNGIIKLIDFGCAKRLCINLSMGQSQILKSMKGTPYWMAPEVVNETGHGKKSDIWSVGCTIFEMATRKPPWAEMNPMAAIFAIGCDKPVPQLPAKFSREAVQFVDACLTRDQNKRPSASQLLQNVFISRRKGSKKQ